MAVSLGGCGAAKEPAMLPPVTGGPVQTGQVAGAEQDNGRTARAEARTASVPDAASLPQPAKAGQKPQPLTPEQLGQIPECWRPLAQRLYNDGFKDGRMLAWFAGLGESYSDGPMGTKLKELFEIKYVRKPKTGGTGPGTKVYASLVTPAVAERCRVFMTENQQAFVSAQAKYGVPKEILVSLIMVETRLGTFLGKKNAFWSLSCLASSTDSTRVPTPLAALPVRDEHMPWVEETLKIRSDWAYKELQALIEQCDVNALDPLTMPGSIYGAVGICQFMPSNIAKFGADGDGDGKIDLFNISDAAHSVANYLQKSGWRSGLSEEDRKEVIKKYNKSGIYANTILVLAQSVAGTQVGSLR